MKNTDITFKEFTKTYIRDFPDRFRYLETAVQIYELEKLSVDSIHVPTPLLKANFNYIIVLTNGSFEQQVDHEIKKISANQALLVVQGEVSALLCLSKNIKGYYVIFDDKTLLRLKGNSYFIKLFTSSPIIQLQEKDGEFVKQISKMIVQELKISKPNEQIILYLFQSLLLKLLKSSELSKSLSRQFDIAISFSALARILHMQCLGAGILFSIQFVYLLFQKSSDKEFLYLPISFHIL